MNFTSLFNFDFDETLASKYITYYFNNIVGYTNDIYIDEFIAPDGTKLYSALLKDDIKRLDRTEGSGVTRSKLWSLFLFSFVDESSYRDTFGTKDNHSRLSFKDNKVEVIKYSGQVSLTEPIYRNGRINHLLQDFIFDKIKDKYRPLMVNTYIYSVNVYATSDMTEESFNTYFVNTNYRFGSCNDKSVIKMTGDINKCMYFIKDIKAEIEVLMTRSNELLDLVNAYLGELPLLATTKYNYNAICHAIDNGSEYVITEGAARTGKTVIAMRLLHKYPSSNLLLMNQFFYQSLKEAFKLSDVSFPEDRIYHHNMKGNLPGNWYRGTRTNNRFLIVDEAQRLGYLPAFEGRYKSFDAFDEIETIIKVPNHEHTIFLGDNLQKLNCNYDRGIEAIIDYLDEHDLTYDKFYFDYSIGIPLNVLESIKYIVYNKKRLPLEGFNNYQVKLYDTQEEFLDSYKNDPTVKKHLSTVCVENTKNCSLPGYINIKPYEAAKFEYFLDETVKNNYVITPYQLISRELDTLYMYLPSDVICTENGFNYGSFTSYLLNQIYVLMTRARISLHIYCESKSTSDYINRKLKELSTINQQEVDEQVDESKSLLVSKLEDEGIKRLVYLASDDNLDAILDNGIKNKTINFTITNPNTPLLESLINSNHNNKYYAVVFDINALDGIDPSSDLIKFRTYDASYSDHYSEENVINLSFNELDDSFYKNYNSWNTKHVSDSARSLAPQSEILVNKDITSKYILDVIELN